MVSNVSAASGVNQVQVANQGSNGPKTCNFPGGVTVAPIGINGTLPDEVSKLCASMKDAVKSAAGGASYLLL